MGTLCWPEAMAEPAPDHDGRGRWQPQNFGALRSGDRSPRVVAARSRRGGRRLRRQLEQRDRQALVDLAMHVAAQESLMFERLQRQSGRGSATQDRHLRYASLLAALYDRLEVGKPVEEPPEVLVGRIRAKLEQAEARSNEEAVTP